MPGAPARRPTDCLPDPTTDMGMVLGLPLFFLTRPKALCASCNPGPELVAPERPLDVSKFTGLWHTAMRVPNWFEDGVDVFSACSGGLTFDATAEYLSMNDGRIGVVNRQYLEGKQVAEVTAQAFPVDQASRREFVIHFDGDCCGNTGRYSVVNFGHFEPDREQSEYDYLLVSGGSGAYGWVLVRDLSERKANRLFLSQALAGAGFAREDFLDTPAFAEAQQPGTFEML